MNNNENYPQKPNILFLSRVWYSKLFSSLELRNFNPYHICINIEEKKNILANNGYILGCFEEEFDQLPSNAQIPADILRNGFYSDRFLGHLSIKERTIVISKLYSFFKKQIETVQFSYCIHETIAIEIDEVFSYVCRENKIKDLTFIHSIIDDHFIWKPNPFNSSIREIADQISSSDIHTEEAKNYIDRVRDKGHKPSYINYNETYIKKVPKARLVLSLIKNEFLFLIRKRKRRMPYSLKEIACYYNSQNRASSIEYYQLWTNLWYWNLSKYDYDYFREILKSFQVIFYPLHFEPEATLLYFSPKYSDQISTIQEILKQLPTNHILVIKEHPLQPGKLLNKEYFDLKRRNSNVLYLPASYNSHDLIKVSRAIITISGSVGWEAAVCQKPVLVLGDVFYDSLPGVTKLEELRYLSKLLMQDKLSIASDEELIKFISKIISISHKGFPNNRRFHTNMTYIGYLQNSIDLLPTK